MQQNEDIFARHNDEAMADLRGKVGQIRELSIAIGDEVRDQNRLLDEMDSDVNRAQGLLGKTMKRLDALAQRSGGSLCMMTMFIVFVFCMIYYMLR
jgi:blocked-early-in-transport protein 1